MKGRINYQIQVKSKEEVVNTFHLSSKRSDVTVYKNDQKLVPGKAREIVINIPEGRNSFEIYPIDSGSYLGRLLFPKKDADLTE